MSFTESTSLLGPRLKALLDFCPTKIYLSLSKSCGALPVVLLCYLPPYILLLYIFPNAKCLQNYFNVLVLHLKYQEVKEVSKTCWGLNSQCCVVDGCSFIYHSPLSIPKTFSLAHNVLYHLAEWYKNRISLFLTMTLWLDTSELRPSALVTFWKVLPLDLRQVRHSLLFQSL